MLKISSFQFCVCCCVLRFVMPLLIFSFFFFCEIVCKLCYGSWLWGLLQGSIRSCWGKLRVDSIMMKLGCLKSYFGDCWRKLEEVFVRGFVRSCWEVRGGSFHSVNSVVELLLKFLGICLVEVLLWKVVLIWWLEGLLEWRVKLVSYRLLTCGSEVMTVGEWREFG